MTHPTRSFLWATRNSIPQLESHQVHVWAWDLDRQPTRVEWELLDPEETQRARRFAYPQDRDRFVCAHAIMRRMLGSYAQIEPSEIRYAKNSFGKPEIAAAQAMPNCDRVHFNLSHSADVAVLAVSAQHPLGVDMEVIRPIEPQVSRRYFSPRELQSLQNMPPELWLRGFFRCWTSKEALLKGEGRALRVPLDSFDVEADPRQPAALLAALPQSAIRASWRLVELQPLSGFVATLAIQNGEQAGVQCFAFTG